MWGAEIQGAVLEERAATIYIAVRCRIPDRQEPGLLDVLQVLHCGSNERVYEPKCIMLPSSTTGGFGFKKYVESDSIRSVLQNSIPMTYKRRLGRKKMKDYYGTLAYRVQELIQTGRISRNGTSICASKRGDHSSREANRWR